MFQIGDKVQIQYNGKTQKQVLIITSEEVFYGETYYFVDKRKCAINKKNLLKIKK